MSKQGSRTAGWQLEASAAEAYEQYFVPILFAPWAERIIDAADLRDGDRVLDVACGTGIVARRAAERVGERGTVVGLDLNEGMLAVAEQAAAEVRPPIVWRRGDAADLPFPDGSFDVVFCQQALQYFPDPVEALGEIRRVLAPGGRAILSVWRSLDYQPGYVVLAGALERHVGDEAGEMMRSPFPPWDLVAVQGLAESAGFDDRTVTIEIGSVRFPSVEEFIRREVASSPLAAQLGDAGRTALVEDVTNSLGGYTDDDGVVLPLESYVLTAYR